MSRHDSQLTRFSNQLSLTDGQAGCVRILLFRFLSFGPTKRDACDVLLVRSHRFASLRRLTLCEVNFLHVTVL